MRLRFLIPIAVFALLLVLFMVGLGLDPEKVPSPLIGKRAPAFELDTVAGEADISEKTFERHRVSLFNVWASWCVACRQEHNFLMALARSGTIPIYGLNWRDERPAALRWLRDLGNPYTANAFDGDGRVGIDWGVYGAPETFLLDQEGRVIYKHVSPLTPQVWREEFEPRIAEARKSESGTSEARNSGS
jgi:cytochrome c biogenesis protein CcmG/thiol:disulfide interchange protein DsbE